MIYVYPSDPGSYAPSGGHPPSSPQARYFEPSDWAAAQLVALILSRMLADPEPSAQRVRTLLLADLVSREANDSARLRVVLSTVDALLPGSRAAGDVPKRGY